MAVLVTMFFTLFGLVKSGTTVFTDEIVEVQTTGKMLVHLWGAGGAGGAYKNRMIKGSSYAGGGGAFVSCYLDVKAKDLVKFRIGQGGRASGFGGDTPTQGDKSAGMSLIFQFIN